MPRPLSPDRAEALYISEVETYASDFAKALKEELKANGLDLLTVRQDAKVWFTPDTVINGVRTRMLHSSAQQPNLNGVSSAVESTVHKNNARMFGISNKDLAAPAHISQWRHNNTGLIASLHQQQYQQVEQILTDFDGVRVEDLATRLQKQKNFSEKRARLIARDQTLKLNARLTRSAHASVGVELYRWSTSKDGSVRSFHRGLEGKIFSYDNPPVTDKYGNRNNPGEDYQCRCEAIPYLPELEGEVVLGPDGWYISAGEGGPEVPVPVEPTPIVSPYVPTAPVPVAPIPSLPTSLEQQAAQLAREKAEALAKLKAERLARIEAEALKAEQEEAALVRAEARITEIQKSYERIHPKDVAEVLARGKYLEEQAVNIDLETLDPKTLRSISRFPGYDSLLRAPYVNLPEWLQAAREESKTPVKMLVDRLRRTRATGGIAVSADLTGPSVTVDMSRSVNIAAESLAEIFPEKQLSSVRVAVQRTTLNERPNANKFGLVKLEDTTDPGTAIHEIGHVIEDGLPRWRSKINAYLDSRQAGRPIKKLADILPTDGYDIKEITREDDLFHPYMGKIYADGSTEFTSMMLEYIQSGRIAEVYAKDPGSVRFFFGLLSEAESVTLGT